MKKTLITRLSRILCLSLFFSLWLGGYGLAETGEEYAVKAAFVFNFVKFCTWTGASPSTDDGIYDLYVVSDNPLGSAFLPLDGKRVGNHLLRVYFKRGTDSFDNADILFISRDIERTGLLRILTAVKGRPILTIGEIPDFSRLGGVINLINKQDGGIRFEINLDKARQQQVEISSRVLGLATIVDSKGIKEE